MEHFYDGQIKRYLTQFMRLMSSFSYKDAKGNLTKIPVRYGDMNRQVAQVMNKNSENVIQSAPFIACYIKGMEFARDRLQDPTYVSKINIRERAYDADGNEYLNTQGANYTVERLMPTPFNLEFNADIWTTNTDQKLQILEQLLVLFNPSMEIQTNTNFVDWTSLSVVELTNMVFSSRSIPQGLEQDIDIATLSFKTPIWLTTPAKVKRLGIITKIITSMFTEEQGTVANYTDSNQIDYFNGRESVSIGYTTLGNLGLMILYDTTLQQYTAKLLEPTERITEDSEDVPQKFGADVNWRSILDAYPGKFTADLSEIRLSKPNGAEIVGRISLNPTDDHTMHVRFEDGSFISNTDIEDFSVPPIVRGNIDAVINPQTFNPRPRSGNSNVFDFPIADTRYLILEDINQDAAYDEPGVDGPNSWKNTDQTNFRAHANDIIQWDGLKWNIIFDSQTEAGPTYITNIRTGIQYVWDGESWMKSFEGVYSAGNWRLIL